jgi:hypothetical protein
VQHSEILQTFAEVGVAFAGFASLISLLGRSSEVIDATRLLGMVRTSLLVTGFSLLPFVRHALGMQPATAWRVSAALLLVTSGTHTYFTWTRLYRMWRAGLWKMRAGYYTFPAGAVSLALAAASAFVSEPALTSGLYLASLAALLSVTGVLFLGVFSSFVRSRRSHEPSG